MVITYNIVFESLGSANELSDIKSVANQDCTPRCYAENFRGKKEYCCCHKRSMCSDARALCELKCLYRLKCPIPGC